MKRYSSSLVVRKMQIKTIMTYHCKPTRMVELKRPTVPSTGDDVGPVERSYAGSSYVKSFGKAVW